jgi:hypothetical protein
MKHIIRLTFVLTLMMLMASMASVTLASPIMPVMDRYSFFVAASTFGGGDIEGWELEKHNGMGMGATIPINSYINGGIRFGSDDYSDHNFALQLSVLPKEDSYLYRVDFNRFGSDGSITHIGVYRDFPGDEMFSLCGGGGISFVSMKGAPEKPYISMFVELQGRVQFGDAFFGYSGISYDYHLGATSLEAGFGMTL